MRIHRLSCLLAAAVLTVGPAAAADSVLELNARPDKVQIIDHVPGTGRAVQDGAWVVMHFAGWVFDPKAPGGKGTRFADSRERGESLSFLYGYRRVVPGLERGLEGMRVGGRRSILVPPKYGYDGIKYVRPEDVPAKATLVFEVELLDVVPQSAPPDE